MIGKCVFAETTPCKHVSLRCVQCLLAVAALHVVIASHALEREMKYFTCETGQEASGRLALIDCNVSMQMTSSRRQEIWQYRAQWICPACPAAWST